MFDQQHTRTQAGGGTRRLAVLALGIVAAMLAVVAFAAAQRPSSRLWGAYVPDGSSQAGDIAVLAAEAGRQPDYVHRFAALGQPVPLARLTAISAAGMTPLLTLEPWTPGAGVDQPNYRLARIAAGEHDRDLQRWAEDLAQWDQPLLLRFAHEQNGQWYPWSVGVNGNSATDYVRAWRHVRAVFRSAGADQARFVWAPNIPFAGASDLAESFPGAAEVDVLGLDGYNWGAGQGQGWVEPEELFSAGLGRLRSLPGEHPILITEVASADGRGSRKAAWIRSLVAYLQQQEQVTGFVWFHADKERDWRFTSTPAAHQAFREALAGL